MVTGFLPAEPHPADHPGAAAEIATTALLERLGDRPPGPTIVYVTLQKTAERVAADLASAGLRRPRLPRRPGDRGAHGGAGVVDGRRRAGSWWPPSPSAWASTRPTCATCTTTTCPRAWRATARRSAAPAATALPVHGRAAGLPRRRARAGELRLRRHAHRDGALRGAGGRAAGRLRRGASTSACPICRPPRHPPAGAAHGPHLPGAAGRAAPGHAVLRCYEVKPAARPRGDRRASFEGERARLRQRAVRAGEEGAHLVRRRARRGGRGAGPAARSHRARARVPAAAGLGGGARLRRCASATAACATEGGAPAAGRPSCRRRFQAREQQEIARVAQVLDLVTTRRLPGQRPGRLLRRETGEPCGHCRHCATGRPGRLPEPPPRPKLPGELDVDSLRALRREHPAALNAPRQVARFLCGLSSPGLSRARLTRHALFGFFEGRRFADVLSWYESSEGRDPGLTRQVPPRSWGALRCPHDVLGFHRPHRGPAGCGGRALGGPGRSRGRGARPPRARRWPRHPGAAGDRRRRCPDRGAGPFGPHRVRGLFPAAAGPPAGDVDALSQRSGSVVPAPPGREGPGRRPCARPSRAAGICSRSASRCSRPTRPRRSALSSQPWPRPCWRSTWRDRRWSVIRSARTGYGPRWASGKPWLLIAVGAYVLIVGGVFNWLLLRR